MTVRPVSEYYSTQFGRYTATSVAPAGTRPVSGGMPYEGEQLCMANGNTCRARRIIGGDLCAGHQKQLDKRLRDEAEATERALAELSVAEGEPA